MVSLTSIGNGTWQVADLRPGAPLGPDTLDATIEGVSLFTFGGGPPLFLRLASETFVNNDQQGISGSIANDVNVASILPLIGANTNVYINGDFGNDTIIGHAGNNAMEGGAGDDLISGGDGQDSANFTLAAGTAGAISSRVVGQQGQALIELTDAGVTTTLFEINRLNNGSFTVLDRRQDAPWEPIPSTQPSKASSSPSQASRTDTSSISVSS